MEQTTRPSGSPLNERAWLGVLLIVLLTFASYSSVVGRTFIWDDDQYITGNPYLRSFDGLKRIWFGFGATQQYYPLTFTSLWIEYHIWGVDPIGYHLVNVALQAVNAVLLWRLLARLRVPGAWLAAALFAIHPVHVESVAWVTELKNVLSGLFYLLAAGQYLTFARLDEPWSADPPVARCWRAYAFCLLFFVAALLSKTVTSTLPAALLLVLWWKRRLTWRDVAAVGPMFVLAILAGAATAHLERTLVGALGREFDLTFADRLLVAGRAVWFYAWKLIWPLELIFIYPRWEIDPKNIAQWIFPIAALVVVVILWLLRGKIGRGPLVAVLFFIGTLFPALGFFNVWPMRYSFVADHFQYLASIGVIALLVATGVRLLERARINPTLRNAVAAGVILVLATRTWGQVWIYDSAETLWTDTIAHNPRAWIAHNNLGNILQLAGENDEAAAEYRRALAIKPDIAESLLNLGRIEIAQGYDDVGVFHVREAMRLDPRFIEGHVFIADALARRGDKAGAIAECEKVLKIDPTHAMAKAKLQALRGNSP